jgi:hypothetical protein
MAKMIDSFENVVRFGKSMYPGYINLNIPKVGRKMTIFAHNCTFEIEPMASFDKNIDIWLTVPDESMPVKG